MYAHWFVVASQKTINIFTEVHDRNKLKLLRTFDNPVPEEASTIPFAKEMVEFLEKEFQLKSFESLTVAAEPHFLGKIKEVMPKQIESLVRNWIRKDLFKIPLHKLPSHLPLGKQPVETEIAGGP